MRAWVMAVMLFTASVGGHGLNAQERENVNSLPSEYVGRWAIVVVEGDGERALFEECSADYLQSASLVVGPTWTFSPTNHTHFLNIERVSDEDGETYRVELVDNAGSELAVTVELLQLINGGRQLEIASDPTNGWHVAKYERCPE